MRKPTKEERKELKDFKFRVGLAIYNVLELRRTCDKKILDEKEEYTVKIGRAVFTLWPSFSKGKKEARKVLRSFKISQW